MRIHCLQHVPFEGPAAIADWAAAGGHSLRTTHVYRGEDLPPLDGFERLVVMGGPMGVHDAAEHPWLTAEKAFLRQVVDGGKSIVGICLGAQLLAEVLHARVYRGPQKEIGWFSVDLTEAAHRSRVFGGLPKRLEVFHWHGDTFDLPPGACHLASSKACAHQAFLYAGRVLGLQFHLESTPQSVRAIIDHCAGEIVPAPYVQTSEQMLSAGPASFAGINRALFSVLDQLPA
jgi:GMP synthase-like glutamine amidotransferase